jgi:putative phosphoesterase
VRILVVADTHVPDGSGRSLDERVLAAADGADLILHAGDVTGAELLAELGRRAPLHAVLGNNDVALTRTLPERLELELDGVQVAMVHDSGDARGRPSRMRRMFPGADLVVFGHSHLPVDEVGPDGLRLVNPGSCTQRRRAPTRTFGTIDLSDGAVRSVQLHHLD